MEFDLVCFALAVSHIEGLLILTAPNSSPLPLPHVVQCPCMVHCCEVKCGVIEV